MFCTKPQHCSGHIARSPILYCTVIYYISVCPVVYDITVLYHHNCVHSSKLYQCVHPSILHHCVWSSILHHSVCSSIFQNSLVADPVSRQTLIYSMGLNSWWDPIKIESENDGTKFFSSQTPTNHPSCFFDTSFWVDLKLKIKTTKKPWNYQLTCLFIVKIWYNGHFHCLQLIETLPLPENESTIDSLNKRN